jgi:hypothetical protein
VEQYEDNWAIVNS